VPVGLVVRFWLSKRTTGNPADRSRYLFTDVVTPSLKSTDDLPSDPSRQARELFNWFRPCPGISLDERRSETIDPLGQEPFLLSV
jgi:hypothetical protein